MYDHLRIEGDPTIWVLSEPVDDSALTVPGQPFQAAIVAPLPGTLVLSGRAAASAVLYSAGPGGVIPSGGAPLPAGPGNPEPGNPEPHGVIPSGDTPGMPQLYLPSVTGLSSQPSGCPLPATTNLAALAAQISTAMTQGTFCTVEYGDGAESGVAVLNGAALPFVVLIGAGAGG